MLRLAFIILAGLWLAGCDTTQQGVSFGGATGIAGSGSACTDLRTPEFAIKGRTAYDQAWINRTTEGLVIGCNQPRPKVRPASFDAPPHPEAVKATTQEPTPEKQAAKRKRWFGF